MHVGVLVAWQCLLAVRRHVNACWHVFIDVEIGRMWMMHVRNINQRSLVGVQVDHIIPENTLDNRRENLRLATRSQDACCFTVASNTACHPASLISLFDALLLLSA